MSTPPWAQQPPYPQVPEPPKKKSKAKGCAGAGCLGIVAVVILGGVISVAGGGKSGSAPAAHGPAAATSHAQHGAKSAAPQSEAHKEKPQTVTYEVTGTSGADVQYGPAGSNAQGKVPMSVTKPLRNTQYYAITAQLQGGGHVTCRLKVNGKVISRSTASGGYNIASCEISKDVFSGKWTDTNAG
ncbi:MmpS family transport accessory protein [Streptomyces sp. NPDC090057]|uniref:MmpS family transport accessory protein n=1 Tax=Streptomyces sp. NPDC090057 TaxID=3365935 RepID=UPI0038103191